MMKPSGVASLDGIFEIGIRPNHALLLMEQLKLQIRFGTSCLCLDSLILFNSAFHKAP